MIAPFRHRDKSERFNHRDIKRIYNFFSTNYPASLHHFRYFWSPWLQEAHCTLSPSLTLSAPEFPFLPLLPPTLPLTARTFPAIVAQHSGYLVVKKPPFFINELQGPFVELRTVCSQRRHLFLHTPFWSHSPQSKQTRRCLLMRPINMHPGSSSCYSRRGLSGSVTSQCILCLRLHRIPCLCLWSSAQGPKKWLHKVFPRSLEKP